MLRLREALHAAEAELKILKTEEQRLRGAIAAYQARVENTPRREQEFQDISRDYDTTKELYQSLVEAPRGGPARREHGAASEGRAVPDPGSGGALDGDRPRRTASGLLADGPRALGRARRVGAVMLAEMLDTSFHSADGAPRLHRRCRSSSSIPRIVTEADRAAAATALPAGRGAGRCWAWPWSSAPPTSSPTATSSSSACSDRDRA